MREGLKEVGLRATPARIAILGLLQADARPTEVKTILRKLKAKAPDQATVYRVLSSLVEAGLVKTVSLKAGIESYEIADLPHHHHLTCEKCGYVEDVEVCIKTPTPTSRSFRSVNSHRLEFSGICNNCS